MKKEIDDLIELAKSYVIFGIEVGLPDTHNNIRGGHQNVPGFWREGDLINVYFASSGDTWAVTFHDVIVTGYSGRIEIPFESNEEYLKSIHDSAKDYLDNYLLKEVAKVKIDLMKHKHSKIKDLERQLRKLKGLC